MTLAQLAWRNIGRNARRSLITLASIASGLAALIFMWAFIDGANEQMVDNTTRYFSGHVQVHAMGYHDDPSLDRTIPDLASVLDTIGQRNDVAAAAPRFEGQALVALGEKSRGVFLAGVDPEVERDVSALLDAVILGAALTSNDGAAMLIGERMAEALGATVGDQLSVISQAYDGSLAAARFHVKGIFRTKIEELDGWTAITPLAAVREFLAAPSGATSVAMRLRDRDTTTATAAALRSTLGEQYEVVGWQRLLQVVMQSVRFHEVLGYAVLLVLFVIVAAGVTNTVLMAVLERTRELGILLALGTRPSRLAQTIMVEAMLLGLGGLVLGGLVGVGVSAYYGASGIDLSAYSRGLEVMPGLSDIIYPLPRVDRTIVLALIVLGTTLLAAVYPSLRAARLEPVSAIRGWESRTLRSSAPAREARNARHIFFAIAARNVLRNPRRSLLTLAGIGSTVVGFVFILSFFDGFIDQTIENATGYVTGHLQIEPAGFRREMSPDLAIEAPERMLTELRAEPRIAAAAARVQTQALASSAAKQEMVVLMGVDPPAEAQLTILDRALREGAPLAPGDDRSVIVGRKLAEKLRVRVGERLVVHAQSADGSLGSAAYRISGIFATESEAFDGRYIYIGIGAARSLVGLGDRASIIGIRLKDRRASESVRAALAPVVSRAGYDVVSWPTLLPQVDEMDRLNRVIEYIVLAIVFGVVALGVLNTILMAVMERTRELGVMIAIGTRPGAMVRVVMYETAIVVSAGIAIGYLLGIAIVEYFGVHGIDLSFLFGGVATIPGLTGVIYTRASPQTLVVPATMLLAFGLLAALYPALRAARLDPAQALRHA